MTVVTSNSSAASRQSILSAFLLNKTFQGLVRESGESRSWELQVKVNGVTCLIAL